MDSHSAIFRTYHTRMARVVDHINAHLDDPLDLDALAEIAALSRFHWHRTYRGITGETVHSTVKRLKLNRASAALKSGDLSIAEIGRQAGYSTPESFGRAFKTQLGMSPALFRKSPDTISQSSNLKLESFAMSIQTENLDFEIKDLPCYRLAALRARGSYNGNPAFNKLFKQFTKQNLLSGPPQMIALFYDDPAIVPESELRMVAGVVVGPDVSPQQPLEILETQAGRYAIFRYKGPYERTGLAYDWIFGQWLPGSGHFASDAPSLDFYRNTPVDTAPEDLLTDICILLQAA